MFQRGGQPSAAPYMSIAQSNRWRQPIPTGSSDYDDTVGGGVSLTAASDFDDNSRVNSHPCSSKPNSKDTVEKPATPSSNLNGNAKIFRPSAQTEAAIESANSEAHSTSSPGVMSSVSQPATTKPIEPVAGEEETDEEVIYNSQGAAHILMDIYYSQQRTRSATISAHQHVADNNAHDNNGYGSSTAHSSPIKYVAWNRVPVAETPMNGVEQQYFGETQEQNNDNAPSEGRSSTTLIERDSALQFVANSAEDSKQSQVARQPAPTMSNVSHHQHAQIYPQITPAANYDTHGMPGMASERHANGAALVTYNHATGGQQPSSVGCDAKVPPFTPAALNAGTIMYTQGDNMQAGLARSSTGYQKQEFANHGAPVMESPQVSHSGFSPGHQHHQNNGLSNGNFVTMDTTRTVSIPQGNNSQLHQAHGPPSGNTFNQQVQMQGQTHGHPGYTYNQPHPPSTYAISYQSHQGQAHGSPMPYSNEHQSDRFYHHQDRNYAPMTHDHPRPQNPGMGGVTPNISVNGSSYQQFKTQDSSSAVVRGYAHGLSGSVSDGSMSQYYPNGQPNTSVALVHVGREPIRNQQTVGPMDFEMPTKETMANRSEMLQALTENGKPSLQDLFDPKFLPFIETYKYSYPCEETGVIVIKNIPYETTRGEVIALLGKTSKILNDRQEPVHIIMDRVTSKTKDAFCELSSLDAAIEMVDKFKRSAESGRIVRIGDRPVDVELSSHTTLMTNLFPSSRNGVIWRGTRPQIVNGSQHPWENFSGFLTEEEMVMLSKHVENSQRSLYARICPERPYECMISTLRKTPWYMAEYITIKERHVVYECCMKMIGALVSKLGRRGGDGDREDKAAKRLSPQLLDRLVTSAVLCPGFSVVQKHNIATTAGLSEWKCREFNQPRFPDSWRHQWVLAPKANMPIDVLEWYISIIRAETTRVVQTLDVSQKLSLQGVMDHLDGYWGFFWVEADFPTGRVWDNMSLAECSRLEWRAIERIITRAIQGGSIPPSYTSGTYPINSAPTNSFPRSTDRRY